ncbi:peroxisomal membrane anchor protein conserved region-domain-containing protein [Hypoxylon trugodes]|uniref:peroxisomal membrane anchor protein conserved region-domain-containing protein n=1 Tax=Hypoxylon trugodes TaxID=326681 RepID=UPI00219DAC8F|nr:peroxisomal membrane anchor protein conserved region-domain-containing protein [Hypoxylon trugodes]KAI1387433.1 peroxisomal membrane anchor protein conserved region-domain-containing protein [Hypoxylon trugodes]
MAIREDVVTSAVSFLQDPNVASAPTENKLSFLRSKHLTQEEIDVAFARSGTPSGSVATSPRSPRPSSPVQHQPYYGQSQYQTQPYGWQAPPPEPPKRDWRDWFIMATVMGGVGYGLYFVTKRYLYPLVSPPTPEKLEQDKTIVDEQFEKAFATLEQLAKDTEDLKSSERERTEKLDKVLEELDSFMRDTKSASRRHEDETDRLREEMKALKAVIPKSMSANKEFTDNRLKEITNEVKSLKSLVTQRLNSTNNNNNSASPTPTSTIPPPPSINLNSYLRPTSGNIAPPTASAVSTPGIDLMAKEIGDAKQAIRDENGGDGGSATTSSSGSRRDYLSALGDRSSPFGSGSGMPAQKASIPAWQLAAAGKSEGQEASGSS